MVGNVGMLKTPSAAYADEAVRYAFTLVAGWKDKDRKEIESALAELREAAKNNEAVYKKAAARLKDLSAAEKAARDALAAAEKAEAAARAAKAEAEAAQHKAEADIAARTQALEAQKREFKKWADEQRKVIAEQLRVNKVTAQDLKMEKERLERLERSVAEREKKAAAAAAAAEAKIAALRAAIG